MPGQRVTVRPIAQDLSLSPTPVNAALSRLAREGILESRLHRGFFVPQISMEDMREIYEVRLGLDLIAVKRICEAANGPTVAQKLNAYCDRQEGFLDSGEIDSYRMEDLRFHQAIWRLSGNKRLLKAGENLLHQMRLGNSISARGSGRGIQSVTEHRSIVHAIEQNDFRATEIAVKNHIFSTEQMLAKELQCPQ